MYVRYLRLAVVGFCADAVLPTATECADPSLREKEFFALSTEETQLSAQGCVWTSSFRREDASEERNLSCCWRKALPGRFVQEVGD